MPLSFTISKPAGAEIATIRLANNTDNFVYDAENEILYLENADLLPAKDHKLTFEIKAKGSCDNVKATKVTVTVNLKK